MIKIGGMFCRCLCLLFLFCSVVWVHAFDFGNRVEENDIYDKQGSSIAGYTTTYTPAVYEPFSSQTPLQYNSLYVTSSDEQWAFPVDLAEPGMPPTATLDDLSLVGLALFVLLYVRMKYRRIGRVS